jgi:sigma-B regulation protein RsbU (phosphoserine phosphatase)
VTELLGASDSPLLAPSARSGLYGRLRQASDRASYLSTVSRAMSGALHTERAMDLVVELLSGQIVDWAQIAVLNRRVLHCRAVLAGGPVQVADVSPSDLDPASVHAQALSSGQTRLTRAADRVAMSSAVPAPELRESLARFQPVDVLTIPMTARGSTYGTLSLALRADHGFDDDATAFLEDFTNRVAVALDTTRALAESRRVATILTRGLNPSALPTIDGVELATYYRVAMQQEALGGDFYDVHGSSEDWTAIVGDVCGKGAEAAMLTGRVRQSVRTAALVDRDPARVLELTNRVMLIDSDDTFVTALCARGRPADGGLHLDFASAGHPEPLVVRADGTVESVPVAGTVLGLLDQSYETTSVRLAHGETAVLFTDGVLEAPGPRDRFGDQRLREVLERTGPVSPAAVVDSIALTLSGHLGDRPHDDIAVLAIQARQPA